tara:strand:- start:20087 stop:20440 length:354 start_codon:yes stop_codon:yes gene_type:complete
MANIFKVITKAGVGLVGSQTTLLTVPSAKTEVILSLLLSNKHTDSIKATVIISSDTTQSGASANADVYIVKDVNIDKENSLEIMSGQKYILNTTDVLKVYADNANLDVVLSYMEQDV